MSLAMKTYYLSLVFLALIVGDSKAPARDAIETNKLSGNISLTLEKGVWKIWQDKRVYQNITLDLSCDRGRCESEVWAYAPQYNQDVDHQGTVEVTRTDKVWQLKVKMKIQSHPWQKSPFQEAEYVIDLVPHKDKLIGNYQGKLSGATLKGTAEGETTPHWPKTVANYKPIQPQEHPRLIFRRDERQALQEKAKTPAGQAILARLRQKLNQDKIYYQGYVPNGGYHAAGYCFLSWINEDKQAADSAWRLVEKSMKQPGKRIFEQGPIVAGVAMAYDLCYNAWDEKRLKATTRWLSSQALWLIQGDSPRRGWNSNAWSNWSARARSAGGLAALAVLDEPQEYFFRPVDARRLSKLAERHIGRYLNDAIGDKGFGTEGDHYTTEPWILSLLPYMQAYRNVIGKDLVAGSNAEWFLAQYLMRSVDRAEGLSVPTYGRHRNYAGGSIFAMGLATVPERFLPGVMWLFRRQWGLEGDRTFSIESPYEAAYVLKGYREDITPKNPAEILDRVLVDDRKGLYVFRDRWQDNNDFVASIYLKREPLKGSWSFPDAGSFRIWGLGGRWADAGVAIGDGNWVDENVVVLPKTRAWKYAQPTSFFSSKNGSGIVSLKTEDIVRNKSNPPVGIGLVRAFAVDYSGSSGVPGLFAVVDKFVGSVKNKDFQNKTWVMHTEGKVTLGDRDFTIEAGNGSTMKGTFVTPAGVKISYQKTQAGGKILATGGSEFFVVMTVQQGQAPPIKISGRGLDSIVRVGNQTIHFGKDRLFLGVF
jgi:hypothetical protein